MNDKSEYSNIWYENCCRVFVSHLADDKKLAKKLTKKLEDTYDISCFLAHDNIEAGDHWPEKIVEALESADALLAYITDDFHISPWTNQEIGFAVGRDIPILSIMAGSTTPEGLLSNIQAMPRARASTEKIFFYLLEETDNQYLRNEVIEWFADSASHEKAEENFEVVQDCFDELNEDEIDWLVKGFNENPNNHDANALTENDAFLRFIDGHSQRHFARASLSPMLRASPMLNQRPYQIQQTGFPLRYST